MRPWHFYSKLRLFAAASLSTAPQVQEQAFDPLTLLHPPTMATLTRTRSVPAQAQTLSHSILDSNIPSPFPLQILNREREQQERLDTLAAEEVDLDPLVDQRGAQQEKGKTESVESDGLQSQAYSQETEDMASVSRLC